MMCQRSINAWKLGVLCLLAGIMARPGMAQPFKILPTFKLKREQEMKTLGGLQFWGDVAFYQGYRIQHNIFFKQYRLLDEKNHRHVSGTLDVCQQKLEDIKKEKKLPPMKGSAVILIHGIVRSSKSFNKMAEELKKDGYTVIGFDYPSTRVEITKSAEYLNQMVESLEGIEDISFVVHSMGGLVVRCYLQDFTPDERIKRMVMLGVPNQGANLADMMRSNLLYKMIFGPAGKQLGINHGFVKGLPTPKFEFGVIAGARGKESGYNPLVPGDDDGTVSVDSARLPGARDYATVKCLHSFLMSHADTISYTREFLKTGQFRKEGERQPILVEKQEESPGSDTEEKNPAEDAKK